MCTFANATARPASYTVTLILEVAFDRSANASGGNSVIVGNGPSRQRFCIASVDVIDRAMVVRADSANAVNDANRANNILTVR